MMCIVFFLRHKKMAINWLSLWEWVTFLPRYFNDILSFSIEKDLVKLLKSRTIKKSWITILLVEETPSDEILSSLIDFITTLPLSALWWAFEWMTIQQYPNGAIEIWYQHNLHLVFNFEKSHCHAERFYLPFGYQRQWIGTAFHHNLVELCQHFDIGTITCEARRSESLNGYYTWARLGYDFDHSLWSHKNGYEKFTTLVQSSDDKRIQSVSSLQELMAFKEWREFWLHHWHTFFAVFDCTQGHLH